MWTKHEDIFILASHARCHAFGASEQWVTFGKWWPRGHQEKLWIEFEKLRVQIFTQIEHFQLTEIVWNETGFAAPFSWYLGNQVYFCFLSTFSVIESVNCLWVEVWPSKWKFHYSRDFSTVMLTLEVLNRRHFNSPWRNEYITTALIHFGAVYHCRRRHH